MSVHDSINCLWLCLFISFQVQHHPFSMQISTIKGTVYIVFNSAEIEKFRPSASLSGMSWKQPFSWRFSTPSPPILHLQQYCFSFIKGLLYVVQIDLKRQHMLWAGNCGKHEWNVAANYVDSMIKNLRWSVWSDRWVKRHDRLYWSSALWQNSEW